MHLECVILAIAAAVIPLRNLQPRHVKVEAVTYQGREATRLTSIDSADLDDGARFALVPNTAFKDGTIEADVAGGVIPGFSEAFRGFTGVAFRVNTAGPKYECFYLRPLNGRSSDQLQRNHSTQYISYPEFPWQRLRKETPGKYESYVDLVPGAWTKVRIVVQGGKASLFVNGAGQPTLIVNDLKQEVSEGAVALWIGPGVVAHFANLRVTPDAR
jgi:hypothetical protein